MYEKVSVCSPWAEEQPSCRICVYLTPKPSITQCRSLWCCPSSDLSILPSKIFEKFGDFSQDWRDKIFKVVELKLSQICVFERSYLPCYFYSFQPRNEQFLKAQILWNFFCYSEKLVFCISLLPYSGCLDFYKSKNTMGSQEHINPEFSRKVQIMLLWTHYT